MDVVEILLLCVVGFSVLVFLILDSLEQIRKTCDICGCEIKTRIGEKSVGADGEDENQLLIYEDVKSPDFDEIAEEEEIENPVSESCEKSGFYNGFSDSSGNNGDDNCRNMGINEDNGEGKEEFIDDDDDWEGIERTDLEKVFGEAVVFVSCNSSDDRIGDVMLELYGLQQIALEGPCYESQPMALKVSARSKWNAWQKLGDMSREMAMEKYVDILSKAIPQWKGEGKLAIQDAATSEDLTSTPENTNVVEAER